MQSPTLTTITGDDRVRESRKAINDDIHALADALSLRTGSFLGLANATVLTSLTTATIGDVALTVQDELYVLVMEPPTTPENWLKLTDVVHSNDPRLSDERTPADGSVTDQQVASNANIALSKIAGLLTALNALAVDGLVVHISGTETITGNKDHTGALTKNGQSVVVTTDTRLSDTRVPTDGSVSTPKLAPGLSVPRTNLDVSTQSSLAKADSAIQANVGGKIDPTFMPAIAINDVFDVTSQSAMLALTAQRGDIARRTDANNQAWVLAGDDPTQLPNWKQLDTGFALSADLSTLTSLVSAFQPGSSAWLTAYANTYNLRLSGAIYDLNGLLTSATVTWPDGTSGVWTTTSTSANGVLGVTVTYAGATTKTVTIAFSYDSFGNPINETRGVS